MKISWNHLQSFFAESLDKANVLERLTMAGLEVEDDIPVAPQFSGVVIGEVIGCERHPDADKLSLCQVNVGEAVPLQIICGATNVAVGVKVPCAKVGAVLPGDFKIAERKMRGLVSYGMLCSGNEIGCPDDVDGLLILPEDAIPGQDIRTYFDLDDHIVEFKITPNRGDCLSYKGLVREIHALTGAMVKPELLGNDFLTNKTPCLTFNADASDACPHYVGLVIKGVNNKFDSPIWLKRILERSSIRSISPLVDITNYVMMTLGQPMHAFDLAKLNGGIGFRVANGKESLKLLDGTDAKLIAGDLIIVDGSDSPVAIAGVMGGFDSGVTLDTTDILLESAFFVPGMIHGRAKAYGVSSDSAYRFERGVDFNLQHDAINLAAQLILEICGGQTGSYVHFVQKISENHKIELNYSEINQLIGEDINTADVNRILIALGCQLEVHGSMLAVIPPSYRFDLKIREDLIEEIIRVHGYDRIVARMPVVSHDFNPADSELNLYAKIKSSLVNHGFNEIISYAFIEDDFAKLLSDNEKPLIKLQNPIAGLDIMRNNLLPDLIKALQYNVNRGYDNLRVFEFARVFHGEEAEKQPQYLAGLMYGKFNPTSWDGKSRGIDFYDLKAVIEDVFGAYIDIKFIPDSDSVLYHPGRCALMQLNGVTLGRAGQLHPRLAQPLGLDLLPYVFELNMELLPIVVSYDLKPVSKYQKVHRDLAFIVDKNVNAADITSLVNSLAITDLISCSIFDIFMGGNLAENQKSVALKFVFQSSQVTLSDDMINGYLEQVKVAIAHAFKGQLR